MSEFSTFPSISASCSLGATVVIVRFSTPCASPPAWKVQARRARVYSRACGYDGPSSFDRTDKLQALQPAGPGGGRNDFAGATGRAFGVTLRLSAGSNLGNRARCPERWAPGTLLAVGRGIPNEMEFHVHFYDERG